MEAKERKRISVTLTKTYVDTIEYMIAEGIHFTPGAVVLAALRHYLGYHGIPPFHLLLKGITNSLWAERYEETKAELDQFTLDVDKKLEKLEAVKEFVLSRRTDIEKDMEDFGMLKPILSIFLEEADE